MVVPDDRAETRSKNPGSSTEYHQSNQGVKYSAGDTALDSPLRPRNFTTIQNSSTTRSDSHEETSGASYESFKDRVRVEHERIMQESLEKLSPEARALLGLQELQRQEHVFNSAMAYTKPWDHLLVSRLLHQAHAAAQVAVLREVRDSNPGRIWLTDYELQVLEIALVLHDFGHVPGSHAMDRVYAAMPQAPKIGEFGYNPVDYHEYHGAIELGKGQVSRRVREILSSKGSLFDDVMAVLTRDDGRELREKKQTYGEYNPTLSPEKLSVLHTLEDRLDRSSFVRLDFESVGYHSKVVERARAVTRRFLETIHVTKTAVSNVADVSRPGQTDPHEALILKRKEHFDQVPMHPTNGLLTAVLQRAAWQVFKDLGMDGGTQLYDWVRRKLLAGSYGEVLGETWNALSRRNPCITDTIAPLVTLDKGDLSERGLNAIGIVRERGETIAHDRGYPAGLVESLAGTCCYDASFFELRIREKLKELNFQVPVYVLIAPVLDKDFEYHLTTQSEIEQKSYFANLSDYSGYVVVAAEAVDEEGNSVNLSALRDAVESIMCQSGWLAHGVYVREKYNPRVFVDPLHPSVLVPEVREKMQGLHPEWIKKGGCGLIRSSAPWAANEF